MSKKNQYTGHEVDGCDLMNGISILLAHIPSVAYMIMLNNVLFSAGRFDLEII